MYFFKKLEVALFISMCSKFYQCVEETANVASKWKPVPYNHCLGWCPLACRIRVFCFFCSRVAVFKSFKSLWMW